MAGSGFTQKATSEQSVIWGVLTERVKWDEKWSSIVNLQYRAFVDKEQTAQTIINLASFHKSDNVTLGLGFIYFDFKRPLAEGADGKNIPEWRPYQNININTKKSKLDINTRFGVEERFQKTVENGKLSHTAFTLRFRLKWELVYKLWQGEKDNSLLFRLSTEPMLQFGKNVDYNTFDQNRFITLLSFQPDKEWSFNTGYMHWTLQTSNGNFSIRHVWLLGLTHTIHVKEEGKICFPGGYCY